MSDVSFGVPVAARVGPFGFLAESLASLRNRRLAVPVILLAILLPATSILLLRALPAEGAPLPAAFAAAAAARLLGLLALAVAVLRVLGASPRPPWRPDGAFWLYGITILAALGIALAARLAVGAGSDMLRDALAGLIVNFVTAPFAVWFVAIAIERPLAWRAGRWLRRFRGWLVPLLLWSILLLLPLGQLHAAIDMFLGSGRAGAYFWPLALADGALSLLLFLLSLALAATAYRHVARG